MTKPLSFRQVQAAWVIALAFAVVCVVVGGSTRKAFDGSLNWRHWLLIGLVAWSAWGGLSVRRKLTARAVAQSSGANSNAASRTWTAGQLVGIMTAESIVLWAVVSNLVIASPQWLSDVFYIAGALLLFKFMPRKPAQIP
jgi:hypothetical protein